MIQFNQPYNREEFTNFLRRDFLPDDFVQEETSVSFATQTKYSKQATKLGVCKSLDLVVYEIKHCGKDDPRVGLSKESFRLLAEEWQNRALIIFVPEDSTANYRFSLIEIKLEGQKDSSKLERKYSNPRRYSYLLGVGIGGHTPNEYLLSKGKIRERKEGNKNLSSWEDLLSRFSVEILTKAFYAELSEWYAWAIDIVTFPGEQTIEDKDKRNEHRSKNVIRLLTRLLFVWFLKQKRLIPGELFDEEYLSANLLKDFAPNLKIGLFAEKSQKSKYYRAILQNLFFATLNCPIVPQSAEDKRERGFRKSDWYGQDYGNLSAMRYENLFSNANKFLELVNTKVPFLNGGLFDCLDIRDNKENNVKRVDIDGFSDNLPKPNQLIVPDYLFFGETAGKGTDLSGYFNDKAKKSVDVLGLLDILKKYNFTIEENTPFDQDVSLDPELLGKVFENLLASYNPETKTTARKQTGSFYTPREIVQYMVDESLVAHLKRTVGEEYEEEYRKLMRYTDEPTTLNDEQQCSIIQSLQNCKVLDPACGSGAFPVGVLQQMVHILSQLDPGNEIWKSLILENSIRELGTTLKDCTPEERDEIQDDINRNFDDNIDRPNYARKLYLIENCIYGVDIQPIAIQISKLRFFISLVVDQKPTTDANTNFGIRPLPNLEAKFVAANTLIGLNKGERNLFDNREVEKLQEKLIQASHRIFGAKSNKTKNKYKAKVEELQNKIATKLLECGDVGNDDARLMREWRMFDQNASSPFFDPEWMFGVSGGFDIVIGNPPYVDVKALDNNQVKEYFKRFTTTTNRINLYSIFIEQGHRILNTSGVLCYINPNSMLVNSSYTKLRELIVSDLNTIIKLPDNIFESATVETIILLLVKHSESNAINGKYYLSSEKADLKNIDFKVFDKHTWESDPDIRFNIFTDDRTISLLKKIEEDSVPLAKLCDFSLGITPYDKAKGHSQEFIKSKGFHSTAKLSDEYVPLIKGSNIHKYCVCGFGDGYLKYTKELGAPRQHRFFTDEKIIFRQILSSNPLEMIVAYSDSEHYFTQIGFSVIPKDKQLTSVKYLVGILNSRLMNYFHTAKYLDSEKITFPKILIENCKQFPIKRAEEPTQIIDLVDKILEAKQSDPNADTTILETKIDLMVYKLYSLTYDEVLIIDPKTPIKIEEYEMN